MPSEKPITRVGLARALSKLGYCSRSQAAELIRAGRVRLNGQVRRDPETPVRLAADRISVSGDAVDSAPKIYLMMNKPRGLVTTASDEKGRDTVYSIIEKSSESLPWLAPVGRLDKASEGLLLLTNDSEWAARITDPATHLDKTYHVQIKAGFSDEMLKVLRKGVGDEGELFRAKAVTLVRSGEKNCWLEIVLDEGRNRHIRRMMDALGIEVLRLIRIAIGPLMLGNLAKGTVRALSREEKLLLDRTMLNSDFPGQSRRARRENVRND